MNGALQSFIWNSLGKEVVETPPFDLNETFNISVPMGKNNCLFEDSYYVSGLSFIQRTFYIIYWI